MAYKSQPPKRRDRVLSSLDVVIQTLNLAKDTCGIPPAQVVFGSASALLTMIRVWLTQLSTMELCLTLIQDTVANEQDYVDLGLACADVCKALDRGLSGRRLDELSRSVLMAVEHLTAAVAEIQRRIIKQGKRNAVSRGFHSGNDKDEIAAWKQELNRILHIFNTELAIDTNVMVADIHRTVVAGQEGTVSHHCQSTQASVPLGEMPPPPPRACFGREALIEEIVGLAENLEPTALIGAGGIGKTSIALAVLHHDRIKNKFGDNRRFIRCDQFPPTSAHLLDRLSKVIGAGVENPEDLTPLRPFLSSKEMMIFLDNAESIFDPQGTDAEKIYSVVEELSRFSNICLGITSRISTIPSHCKRPTIPTLSTESACDIFYGIYSHCGRSDVINDLVRQLDFHALSITLLATTASHNMWDYDRLVREWDTRRTQVLRTDHCGSLAATIEISLASPTFHGLVPPTPFRKLVTSPASRKLLPSRVFRKNPPSARDLLEVVAFFPQGIDEKNLDWLFPAVSERKNIFDKFCVLSLTYRHHGFITMLAPIRDYFLPQDPNSSPLIRTTKDCYFTRLSAKFNPDGSEFGESQWIKLEDVNIEHLLDVFTSIDGSSDDVWNACVGFIKHIHWHKPRRTILMQKIEDLPDDRRSKPRCLLRLADLSGQVGNNTEKKRLLVHTLALWRKRGDDLWVAQTLQRLSGSNLMLGLYKEGIQQAKEASDICKRLGKSIWQAQCLNALASLLHADNQLDAAEDTVSRAMNLLPEKGQEYFFCESHQLLGLIHRSRGDKEKAVFHFETVLRIASPFNWHHHLFWTHYNLAWLFCDEGEFDNAIAHIELTKSHAVDDAYKMGRATQMHAWIFHRQHRLEDARSETLRALEIYEKLGATRDAEWCRDLLRELE